MKFVDEFREPRAAQNVVDRIRSGATQRWVLMEVCGGQTHGLLRSGIPAALEDCVEMIHGPGCPVCVTSEQSINFAQWLALRPGTVVASFGDMLRVPGTSETLLSVRSRGGDVRTVYSPIDAVQLAVRNPDQQVVFFAVGFETTAPATALAVLQARELGLTNFSLLVSHVRVQPAMELIASSSPCRVQAFLAAGHVCAITGFETYFAFSEHYHLPVVVTGFEPLDLLYGILECVEQLESGRCEVSNCYGRAVSPVGNTAAQQIVDSVYEVTAQDWRGLGVVPFGGFRLRSEFADFDAGLRFTDVADGPLFVPAPEIASVCRAGDILSGQLRPCDCPEFARACTPDSPLGAPMVSSEGACAAYFRYRQPVAVDNVKMPGPVS